MEQYDSFLTRFKKDLWSKCVEQKVFDFIPEDKVNKTKEIFENNVLNYQNQILQFEGKGKVDALYTILIQSISKELTPLKNMSRDTISQQKKDVFDQQFEAKQKEFNQLMNKEAPPTPQFSDEKKDNPLDNENLEQLIQRQMKERETVMNINQNDSQNNIIADNQFTQQNQLVADNQFTQQNQVVLDTDYTKIVEQLKIHSTILQQIVQSQIAILKKLK